MSTLEKAIMFAIEKHSGQVDKGNQLYVLHPLRVMLKLESESDKIIAVLHDVLEDTDATIDELKEIGINEVQIETLQLLTKLPKESYDSYIQRISTNKIAAKIKIADLKDNMDISRIPEPTKIDYDRVKKYKKYYKQLIDIFIDEMIDRTFG